MKRNSNPLFAVSLIILLALMVSFGACLVVEDDCCEETETACSDVCHCACAFHSTSPPMPLVVVPLNEAGQIGHCHLPADREDFATGLFHPPRLILI